jgi:hypothetical protein
MNLSKLASLLSKAAVYTRDVNAVTRRRTSQRVANRMIGRAANKALRRLWR